MPKRPMLDSLPCSPSGSAFWQPTQPLREAERLKREPPLTSEPLPMIPRIVRCLERCARRIAR
jgi:hypothetical protein